MRNIILLINKELSVSIYDNLKLSKLPYNFILIKKKPDLNYKKINKINPKYIFVPFWSFKIKKNIYSNFTCINFHMTDLPFGRGGTPLQNLIINNYKTTKITAFKCNNIIDGGDIYIKEKLRLNGNADQILNRASKIINKMIKKIIIGEIVPRPQKGKIYKFKRRTAVQSKIKYQKNLQDMYNFIRMLDGVDYPKSYIETKNLKFEFNNAKMYKDHLTASVKVFKK